MSRFVHVEPKFWRLGCSPFRFVACHASEAMYTIRSGGVRIGNWYVYLGQ